MPCYRVYNRKTKQAIGGTHKTRASATRKADRLDREYGAYAYGVEQVETPEEYVQRTDSRQIAKRAEAARVAATVEWTV